MIWKALAIVRHLISSLPSGYFDIGDGASMEEVSIDTECVRDQSYCEG